MNFKVRFSLVPFMFAVIFGIAMYAGIKYKIDDIYIAALFVSGQFWLAVYFIFSKNELRRTPGEKNEKRD